MLREKNNNITNFHDRKYNEDLSKDILNRIAFSLTINDFIFKFQKFENNGFEYTKDRGYAFEEQLNDKKKKPTKIWASLIGIFFNNLTKAIIRDHFFFYT